MGSESTTATKSSLGRVLAKRKLKERLATVLANERDPLILRRQIQHLRDTESDAELIKDRIDDALILCSQQIRIELHEGRASTERAAQLLMAMDKSNMSPADLDAEIDRYIGAGNRQKFSPHVAALEQEVAQLKERWGKEKTLKKYRDDFLESAEAGGFLNLGDVTRTTYPLLKKKFETVAAPLGLSEAEYMAVASYSMEDFAYMNPAVANHKDKGKGDGWMKAANLKATGNESWEDAEERFQTGGKNVKGSKASLYEEGALHAGMLQQALQKLKDNDKIYREADLFRGTRVTPSDLKKFKVGGEYVFENFTSLSTSEDVSRRFAAGHGSSVAADRTVSILFKVRLKGWDIKDLSALGHENEMLVQPSRCRIVSIEDDVQQDKGAPPATAWKVITLAPDTGAAS